MKVFHDAEPVPVMGGQPDFQGTCSISENLLYCSKRVKNKPNIADLMKKKIELEYTINSSPRVLFNRLSTPGGLAEWFADDVNLQQGIYTFIWEQSEQQAEVVQRKDNKYIRFRWIEDEDKDSYFEFRLNQDELTGDVSLMITDFAEDDETSDAVDLWDTQIAELKHVIGL
jgi:uncharacterized protein YndB with AHSA1/START domain